VAGRGSCRRGLKPGDHTPALFVSGIADPRAVRAELAAKGIELAGDILVGDHEPIPRALLASRVAGAHAVVTTAKDYWRDPEAFDGLGVPVFILPLTVELDDSLLDELARPTP
jgi:tetraacyldisaccharide-1-P 4'-kinase